MRSRQRHPVGADDGPIVVFIALARGIGGSTRSLATVLAHLRPGLVRALAVPKEGKFPSLLKERSLLEEHIPLPGPRESRFPRLYRLWAAGRIARWVWARRARVVAIHANGPEELNVAAPAALIAGVPIVMWSHARDPSPWMKRLAPVLRRLLRKVRWAAVSESARRVLVKGGLTDGANVEIIPNPIDPLDVLCGDRAPSSSVSIGYLGSDAPYKGLQFLPDVVERLDDQPVTWLVFASERARENGLAWRRLRSFPKDRVSFPGKLEDVRPAYAACDIVFCPSLEETFCRVAAEAMLNGIPVVGSDLEPLRHLLGSEEAGLLFPAGDVGAAADAIRRLVADPDLRRRMGEVGRARARSFDPERVAAELEKLYGIDDRSIRAGRQSAA